MVWGCSARRCSLSPGPGRAAWAWSDSRPDRGPGTTGRGGRTPGTSASASHRHPPRRHKQSLSARRSAASQRLSIDFASLKSSAASAFGHLRRDPSDSAAAQGISGAGGGRSLEASGAAGDFGTGGGSASGVTVGETSEMGVLAEWSIWECGRRCNSVCGESGAWPRGGNMVPRAAAACGVGGLGVGSLPCAAGGGSI